MPLRQHIKTALDTLSAVLKPGTGQDTPAIQASTTKREGLEPNPLPPEWIRDGSPAARSLMLTRSSDELLSSGLWECSAGRFKFVHDTDEIVHIVAGEVTVSQGGASHTLRPGDVAHFPAGLTTYWEVPEYVKKFWVQRAPVRSALGRLRSRLGV